MSDFLSLYDESDNFQPTPEESSPLCEQLSQVTDAYSKEELIAQGGMKSISKVYCEKTHRYVAKATLKLPESLELREAFIREARLTAMLDHPNIIKIYEIALSAQGEPYFTMEFKTGSNLNDFLKGQHSISELLEVFVKICDAIAYAHSRRVLHLDLKPENIQVGSFGEVIVCDWGLGRIITSQEQQDESDHYQIEADILNHCTLYGEAKGTPGYMAPEQLLGDEKNEQTDIYALGALLFTLLAPERHKGKTTEKLIEETRQGHNDTLSQEINKLPASLKAVTLKAMAQKPSNRYSSIEDLQKDVRRYLNKYPTEAQGADFWLQSRFFWRRNRRICQTILASTIILMSCLLVFLNRLSQSEQQTSLALKDSKKYAESLEKTMNLNKDMAKSLDTLPKDIVSSIFAQNQQYRDYQLLMTPKVSLQRSNQFLEAAYKTEPENSYIFISLAANYFIAMDFDKLQSISQKHPKELGFYQRFFKKVSEELLINKDFDTYKYMINVISKNAIFSELLIAYHAERFCQNKGFTKIIQALIKRHYPNIEDLTLTLKEHSLEMWAPKLSKMTSPVTKLCLLRYLKFKDLFIADNSISDANELVGLNLRKLHLQHTQIRDLVPLLKISNLDHITIQQGQIPEQQLTKFSKHFTKDLVQVYKAIKAKLSNGVSTNFNHPNYTSRGFVDGFYRNNKGTITFRVKATKSSQENIVIRYSAGHGDAKILLIVNGTPKDLTLKSTGSWEQWGTANFPINFKQGENTLVFKMKHSTNKCFNLDSFSRKVNFLALP